MSQTRHSGARYQALIQLLRTAEDLWNASRTFFARWNLSPSQFNILNVLHDRPGGLSQSELSRLLIMHRSNATGLVDRLEQRGLVSRHDDAADRRAYRVELTAAGNGLLEAIYPEYFEAAEQVWADVPEANIQRLLVELQDLAVNAGNVAAPSNAPSDPPSMEEARRPTTKPLPSRPARSKRARENRTAPFLEGDVLRTSDL